VLRFAVETLDGVAEQLDDADNRLARFRDEGKR